MIHKRILAAAIAFLIQTHLSASTQIDCDQNYGNYTAADPYGANLNTTLSSLSTNIDGNGFYNASTGDGSDRVYALALCRGDLLLEQCRDCVRTSAAELVGTCRNQKQAIVWYEKCTVRYSNATIAGILSSYPAHWSWYPQNATSPAEFNKDVRLLMEGLRVKAAAGSSLRKVAAGNITGPDFQTIFALV